MSSEAFAKQVDGVVRREVARRAIAEALSGNPRRSGKEVVAQTLEQVQREVVDILNQQTDEMSAIKGE